MKIVELLPFQNGSLSLKKQILSRGPQLFLQGLDPTEKGGKMKIVELLPFKNRMQS